MGEYGLATGRRGLTKAAQAEWDKYFPLEENTGDLDIPGFDFADFNGGYGGQPMDIATLMAGPAVAGMGMGTGEETSMPPNTSGMALPTAEDLTDVDFAPSYYIRYPSDQRAKRQW